MATTKKKARPPMHARITEAWYKHPIAIVLGACTFIGSVASVVPSVRWLMDRVDAKAVHEELEAHKIVDLRDGAWRSVSVAIITRGLIDARLTAVRNRVNDCNVAKSHNKAMTPIEQAACDQYQTELAGAQGEYVEATRKLNEARAFALAASKEK